MANLILYTIAEMCSKNIRCLMRVQSLKCAAMSGTVPITIRVKPELRDRLLRLAKADKRTLSSYLAIQLEELAEQLETPKK